ncbi:MAG: hypothetical protein AAB392_01855 [Patescibacteria group bacterium]
MSEVTKRSTEKKDHGNSLISNVYKLLHAENTDELYGLYLNEDQKIVISKIKDYISPRHITTKIKNILEKIDTTYLSKKEGHERRLILWLWYHHAISYAIWGYKNKKMALKYSSMALKYQPKDNFNKITRLLYLLIRKRLSESQKWLKKVKKSEKKTALMLIKFYKDGGFFE